MSITKISPSVVDFDAGITISTTDNTSNLILTSTDADANVGPVLELYRNSSSPADNDELARIYFYGENDNDEKIEYGLIRATIVDASDSDEGSLMQFLTYTGGGQKSRIELLEGETVFNEGSSDIDFRVESDAQSLAFFVDGGENAVGLQTNTEADGTAMTSPLTVNGANHGGNTLEMHRTGNSIHRQYMNTAGTSTIDIYGSSSPNLQFSIAGSAVAKVNASGICFGSDTAAANALDDYEEGTYSPVYGASSADGTVSYGAQTGWYTKVGNLVTVYVDIAPSSASGQSGLSEVSLPFTAANQFSYMAFVPWDVDTSYTGTDNQAIGYVYPNTSRMRMYHTEGSSSNAQGSININTAGRISGTIFYYTAT